MLRWSGNLLATCLILLLGITFARQVLQWWHGVEPRVTATAGQEAVDDFLHGALPCTLALGDLPLSLQRTPFQGTEQAALAALRADCRSVLVDDASALAELPFNTRLQQQLESLAPVERGRGWRIVQHGGPVITVVGLRTEENSRAIAGARGDRRKTSMVSWGLGLRCAASDDEVSSIPWMLYTCFGRNAAADPDAARALPLPPGCRRVLTAHIRDGGAVMGFAGPCTAAAARAYCDTWFAQRAWRQVTAWRQVGTSWHTRFQQNPSCTCDIQIIDGGDMQISGILTTSNTPPDAKE